MRMDGAEGEGTLGGKTGWYLGKEEEEAPVECGRENGGGGDICLPFSSAAFWRAGSRRGI